MKSKRILRFYFAAESLDRALNNLITAEACLSGKYPAKGEVFAGKLCTLIADKGELSRLWRYLDGIIGSLKPREAAALERYARLRRGLGGLGEEEAREIRSAAMKFTRHARSLHLYVEGVRLVDAYYSLCSFGLS